MVSVGTENSILTHKRPTCVSFDIKTIEKFLEGTPLYTPCKYCYIYARKIYETILDMYISRSLHPGGLYEISPTVDGVPNFMIYLPGSGEKQRQRVVGKYENDVLKTIQDEISEDSIFWEIGAAWGYFSLSLAPLCDSVVVFEASKERINQISRSISANGYDNIDIIQGRVDQEIDFSKLQPPNVILMDIEGWEYEVLQNLWSVLEAKPVLVIEIHERADYAPGSPEINPNGVYSILDNYGYEITEISERTEYNWHILATPES